MEVHIIIPTHKRLRLLQLLLDSLVELKVPQTLMVRATVVENGSHVAEALVASYANGEIPVSYVQLVDGNKSAALNKIVSAADPASFLLFFDDDIIIAPDLLMAYAAAIEAFGRQCFYGGPVVGYYDSSPPAYLVRHLPESAGSFSIDSITSGPADISSMRSTMLGANWGVFADALQSVRSFDPAVGPGSASGVRGQETDAMRRLVKAGVSPVYVPRAGVQHYVPDTVLTEQWLTDRFTKTFTYAGSKRRTAPVITREMARLVVSYAATLKSKITGRESDRIYAVVNAAKSKGFFKGLGLPWLTAGL